MGAHIELGVVVPKVPRPRDLHVGKHILSPEPYCNISSFNYLQPPKRGMVMVVGGGEEDAPCQTEGPQG